MLLSSKILNPMGVTNDYYSLYTKYYSSYNDYKLDEILNSKEREAWLNKCRYIKETKGCVINLDNKSKDIFHALEIMADLELLLFERKHNQISDEEVITSPIVINYINNKITRVDEELKTKYCLALEYYDQYLLYRLGDRSSLDLIDSLERKKFLETIKQIPYYESDNVCKSDFISHELYSNICINLLDLEIHNGIMTDEELELTNSFKDFCKYQHNRNKKKLKLKMTS